MKILNAQQLQQADKATIKNEGIASIELMERASEMCFYWLENQELYDKNIHIFCGMGNNGGDGLAIARMLYEEDYMTGTYVVHFSDKMSDDFVTNYQRAEGVGIHPGSIHSKEDFPEIESGDIVIDAIFGIGLNKPVKGIAKELIDYINQSKAVVYSIDVPSGLFIDKPTAVEQSVIKSKTTLTFQTPKLAFLLPENEAYVNNFLMFDIGLDKDFVKGINPEYQLITSQKIREFYKERKRFSHKGDFGHALIIGGSFGKIGAIQLAAKAALRIGAGLVTAYIPKCGYSILQTAIPEVMVEVDAEDQLEFFNYKTKATVIGVGVGMGTSEKTTKAFGQFLEKNTLPLVLDADALNIISKNKHFLDYLPENCILTPHPKELKRLLGDWENDYDKLKKIQSFVNKYNCVLVVKGAHTIVADKQNFYFNSSGTPALATAGTGDVLTGLITGLLAQKYTALEAALAGVFLHGTTADLANKTFIASDIFNILEDAISIVVEHDNNFIKDFIYRTEDMEDDLLDDFFFDDEDEEDDDFFYN